MKLTDNKVMEAGYSGAMGSDEEEPKKDETEERVSEKKKLNDDLAVFMRKRSESDVPRYYATMKNYVKLQHKRKRAEAARKRSDHLAGNEARKKAENQQKDKPLDGSVRPGGEEDSKRRGHEKIPNRSGSVSGQRSQEPADCGCRRRRRSRRRCCVRRPRRSCRRRRRSRCRRRRRRSCRRRRRSCRRRRRRRR